MTKKQKIQYLIFNIFLIATYFIIGYFFGYFNNSNHYIWVSVIVFLASLILCFIGYFRNTSSLLKLEILILLFAVLGEIFLYFFIKYDLFEKFNSIDKIKNIIMQYKGVSALIFIAIQFLQVTIIPIPSTITTMAGGIIFGFWKSFFYSLVGIISGSMFAFFLGRKFGTKLAVWIFGEKLFNKYQVALKGKDKFLMFMMFILPFFPDDLICILAGLTEMKYWGFFAMMLIVRPIGIATVSGAFNGIMSIPFEGWGIALWLAIVVAFVVFVALVWKYGGKIQDKFLIFIEELKIKIASKKSAKSPNKANIANGSNSTNSTNSSNNIKNSSAISNSNSAKNFNISNCSHNSNCATSAKKNKLAKLNGTRPIEVMAKELLSSKESAIEESPIDEREQNLPQKIKHIYELENSTKTTIIAHSDKKNSSTNFDNK